MSVAITRNGTPIPAPRLWMDYKSSSAAATIAHPLMSGGIAIVHRPTPPRTCTLALFYPSEADALAAETAHRSGGTFTISETGRPSKTMTYVVVGSIERALDPTTARNWIVAADVQAVA